MICFRDDDLEVRKETGSDNYPSSVFVLFERPGLFFMNSSLLNSAFVWIWNNNNACYHMVHNLVHELYFTSTNMLMRAYLTTWL